MIHIESGGFPSRETAAFCRVGEKNGRNKAILTISLLQSLREFIHKILDVFTANRDSN